MYALFLFGPQLEVAPRPAAVPRAVPARRHRRKRPVGGTRSPIDDRGRRRVRRDLRAVRGALHHGPPLNLQTGGIVLTIVANLVFTFAMPNIDWRGHVGGLVVGAAMIMAILAYAPQGPRGLSCRRPGVGCGRAGARRCGVPRRAARQLKTCPSTRRIQPRRRGSALHSTDTGRSSAVRRTVGNITEPDSVVRRTIRSRAETDSDSRQSSARRLACARCGDRRGSTHPGRAA